MKTTCIQLPRHRLFALVLSLSLWIGATLGAQTSSTGTITGRVYEVATGRSLQGATVMVVGTTAVDYTDADGRFTLPAVPAGTVSVEVEYVGLDLFKQTVSVTAGSIALLNAELKSEILTMAAFEVAEAARGQALAINQQKTARGIVNIVSEETFGAMHNGNIGYALQRLPGLTVNEGEDGTPEGVNIRGLGGDFNSFTLDGNRIGTRGFSTSNLVADGIANIEVIKANTPDRDGDALGGTINVISRTAFQRDGREIRLGASVNYLGLAEEWGHNLRTTYSDLYGLFGEQKNLGVSVTLSHYTSNRYYENNDTDWNLIRPENNPTYNLPGFPFYYNPNMTVQYNLRASESYAVNVATDFRIGKNHTFYFKPLHSHTEVDASRYLSRPYIDTRFQDAINGRKTFEFLEFGRGRGTAGPNGSRGEIRYSAEESETHTNVYAFSTGGRHELGSSTINYDAFFRHTHYVRTLDSDFIVRNVPSARGYFQWEYDSRNALKPLVWIVNGLDPRDTSTINRGDLSIEPEERWENAYNFKADWEKKFVGERLAGALKFGAKYQQTKQRFEQDQFEYDTTAAFPYAQVMKSSNRSINGREMFMEIIPSKVRALLQSNPELFPYVPIDSLRGAVEEDYDAKETTTAAYAMGTVQIGKTTIASGIRAEHNTWKSLRKSFDARTLTVDVRRPGTDYTQFLPGIHFRHELQKNLILRESYNRSYARPTLSRLTLGRSEDVNGNIAEGNPFLDPTTSHNADAQIEKYTEKGGLYSAGVFYKKMKGFYYNTDRRFNVVDPATGDPIIDPAGTRRYRRWENAEGATNYGLELIFQQKMYFLPPVLRGLTANISATFSESDAKYPSRADEKLPTIGFSDYMFNAALDYAIGKFRANIRYAYRSDYLTGVGDTRYTNDQFAAREQVDVEASYRLTRKFRINANVINLTSRPQVSYQSFPAYVEDNSMSGWRATVGVDYTF
ncbi:MAG: TonB-dependent receptor [Verrucomicrobia bacterium]|nr:TonB-dependent receptor [Verrucomicrobiota bacterium]